MDRRQRQVCIRDRLELAYSLVAYRQLVKAAQDFQPDFIYERYNLFLLSGTLLKRKLGIPLLLEVNAPLVDERLRNSGGLGPVSYTNLRAHETVLDIECRPLLEKKKSISK